MSHIPPIKAVLFDMDGVLIDAKDWHYEALNEALALFGCYISRHDHLTSFDGLPTKTKLARLSLLQNLPVELHAFINQLKQQFTMQHIYKKCSPTFSHQYALSNLKLRGYKLAVCSNSIRHSIDVMMELAALAPYLDKTWSAQDVTAAKPDPEIYIKAINYFSLKPSEVLIVEDNENGIRAAKAAGAHCLEVKDVTEVNWTNLVNCIANIEKMGELV